MRIAAAAFVCAAWLGAAACAGDNPAAPSPPAAGSHINYAAIGASDVIGIGSSVPCVPFSDCAGGTGYVFVAGRRLRSQGYTVRVDSRGIPTAVISRRFMDLGIAYGRTILGNIVEQAVPFVPADSTVVTIFAGANEVNVITAALGGGAGGGDPAGYVDRQVRAFGEDFTIALNGTRAAAPAARVIILNVPNVGALPMLSGAAAAQRQAAQRAAVGMTRTVVNPLASGAVRVVDLMCDARLYGGANLSSDGFHPNDAGHALLASEVVRAITASSYPAPQSSCAQMSLVP